MITESNIIYVPTGHAFHRLGMFFIHRLAMKFKSFDNIFPFLLVSLEDGIMLNFNDKILL